MERIEFFIYILIFLAIVYLVIKHRKTGKKQ